MSFYFLFVLLCFFIFIILSSLYSVYRLRINIANKSWIDKIMNENTHNKKTIKICGRVGFICQTMCAKKASIGPQINTRRPRYLLFAYFLLALLFYSLVATLSANNKKEDWPKQANDNIIWSSIWSLMIRNIAS